MNAPALDFQSLVETYYTPLYRFAYSLAGNEADASDLTQQTFTIWAEKGSSLRDTSKVKSWLFTTLHREFLRLRRKGNRSTVVEEEVLDSTLPPVEPEVATSLDAKTAVAALQEIDPTYREPLVMFYMEDMAYKEIAETLDIPIGTVMSRLSRGKAQLKILLTKKSGK